MNEELWLTDKVVTECGKRINLHGGNPVYEVRSYDKLGRMVLDNLIWGTIRKDCGGNSFITFWSSDLEVKSGNYKIVKTQEALDVVSKLIEIKRNIR